MKKLLAAIALGLAIMPTFAATQYRFANNNLVYTVTTEDYATGTYFNGVAGNYYKVNVLSGSGTFYIADKITSLTDNSLNVGLLKNEMFKNADGTYNYGWLATNGAYEGVLPLNQGTNRKLVTTIDTALPDGTTSTVEKTYYELNNELFTAGDEFGIWIANKSDTIATSLNTSGFSAGNYGLNGVDATGSVIAELDYATASEEIFYTIKGVGQPLPGVLFSIVLGCGALGFCGRRKKA